METVEAIATLFLSTGEISRISSLGKGHINNTFLVSVSGAPWSFVLQRLNPFVFTDPAAIMANIRIFSHHARGLVEKGILNNRRWELVEPLTSMDGRELVRDESGAFWRAIPFIDNARTVELVRNQEQACEIGQGLAIFHMLSRNIPVADLADTLPGFHITPHYLELYNKVVAKSPREKNGEENHCLSFINANRSNADLLEVAKHRGILTIRAIHGDPKIDNFMVDESTGQVVALIDLDTIVPGLILYDIGDCLRSVCNPKGEEPDHPTEIRFEPDLCQAVLAGYLQRPDTAFSQADCDYLFDAIRLIPFELGLRFFTDHLAGNPYFKTEYPEQNLVRAMNQFRLVESIKKQEGVLRAMITDLYCRR